MSTTTDPKPSKRKPKPKPMCVVVASEAAMLGLLNEWTELHAQLAAADAEHVAKIAALNSQHDEAHQAERERLAVLEASVRLFVTTHRTELFPDETKTKSREYNNAVVGFRQNPPSVKALIKGDTEKMIAERLADTEWGGDYMSWEPKLNKAALLRDRETITHLQQAEVGLRFEQEEEFFMKSKLDQDARATAPASTEAAA